MNNGPLSLILWMDSQQAILFIWFNLYYNSSFKNYLFFILFERQRDRYFPLANSLSKHVQQPELGWFKARILELYPGLSWGWWEPKYLSHDLLPPKMCISKRLGENRRPWTGTRHSHRWCGHPKWRHDIMAALYVPPTIPSSWSIYAIHSIKWLLRDKDTRFLIFSRLCSFSLSLPCDEGNV